MAVEALRWHSIEPFALGYEHCVGTAVVALDPSHPANQAIVDLALARRDPDGRVRFETDVVLLRAPDPRGLLHVVANRGLVTALPLSSGVPPTTAPSGAIEVGDGFVLRRGLCVGWVGWQWDVQRRPGAVGLDVPEALDADGRPIAGQARLGFQPVTAAPHRRLADLVLPAMGEFHALPAADLDDPDAVLTEREWFNGPRTVIPRSRWRFARDVEGSPVDDDEHVWLEGGFRARAHYELTYTTRRCPVTGAGLAAVRDVVAHLRRSFAPILAFGVSQSGRWLRQLVLDTGNADEHGRPVFDGMLCHLAGGRRGEFNHRYAQPSTMNPLGFTHLPPFSPEDGLFARARAGGTAPRTLFTNSATEYWRGDGSLVHPVPEGSDWRAYLYAGTHHAGQMPGFVEALPVQLAGNPVEILWGVRAHLVALEGWVREGVEPPPSAVPRTQGGTGVSREDALAALSSIPALAVAVAPNPDALLGMPPLDLGPDADHGVGHFPPVLTGAPRPCLVSALDTDGNEVAGVRLPELSAPLGVYLGWNPEVPRPGVPVETWNLVGGWVPFPSEELVRRYQDRDGYLARVRAAAAELVTARHLLAEDVDEVVRGAGRRWDETLGS